jgi:microcystin-dependent protein
MADPFVAEIRIFPFTFAPKGWAFCNGQLVPISQNTALFSLLSTNYGGDGRSNFALPDLQGSVPMHPGQGPGLSSHVLGEKAGSDTVALVPAQIPAHTHTVSATTLAAVSKLASANVSLARSRNGLAYQDTPGNAVVMHPSTLATAGESLPHNNMQPYLTLNFCIALQGVFPAMS